MFGDLLRKWRLFMEPDAYPGLEEALSGIEIQNYRIESNVARLRSDRIFRGACGSVEYSFSLLSEYEQIALNTLAGFAFFTGTGYKTSQGMGETWPYWRQ